MLRAEAVAGLHGPTAFRFTVRWQGENACVQTRLCGAHWLPAGIGGAGDGSCPGRSAGHRADAVSAVEPFEGCMSPVELGDGVVFIRDDWKAPF